MSRSLLLAALMAAPVVAVAAQDHPLVGAWKITYAGGVRVENGASTPIEATARLTVEVQGDSLIAHFVPDPVEGRTRPPFRLAARNATGAVTFIQRSEATVTMGGSAQSSAVTTRWTLMVSGDTIDGTIDRSIEGLPMPTGGPQPVSGTRQRS